MGHTLIVETVVVNGCRLCLIMIWAWDTEKMYYEPSLKQPLQSLSVRLQSSSSAQFCPTDSPVN